MTQDTGHWNSKIKLDPSKNEGFVYIISHKDSKKFYIGKKLFFNKIGKKRCEKWKNYTSSSRELNALIELHGKDRFNFLIISQHPSKTLLSYAELLTQINHQAMFDPNCLNGIINVRLNKRGFTSSKNSGWMPTDSK